MNQIAAVTFDLWQTLLIDNREMGHARTQARLAGAQSSLSKLGETYALEHIEQAYRASNQRCQAIRLDHLDVSFREQVALFVEEIDSGLTQRLPEELFQEIAEAYADSFFVHPPLPHPAARSVLQGVQKQGLLIGLISNTGMTPGVTFRRFLEQHDLLPYFDTLVFSDEVGVCKPACAIFNLTLNQLGVGPEQTIHVGDHPLNDVAGAKACGLKAIWIEGFYEPQDPADPRNQPDVAVPDLAQVLPAIRQLAQHG